MTAKNKVYCDEGCVFQSLSSVEYIGWNSGTNMSIRWEYSSANTKYPSEPYWKIWNKARFPAEPYRDLWFTLGSVFRVYPTKHNLVSLFSLSSAPFFFSYLFLFFSFLFPSFLFTPFFYCCIYTPPLFCTSFPPQDMHNTKRPQVWWANPQIFVTFPSAVCKCYVRVAFPLIPFPLPAPVYRLCSISQVDLYPRGVRRKRGRPSNAELASQAMMGRIGSASRPWLGQRGISSGQSHARAGTPAGRSIAEAGWKGGEGWECIYIYIYFLFHLLFIVSVFLFFSSIFPPFFLFSFFFFPPLSCSFVIYFPRVFPLPPPSPSPFPVHLLQAWYFFFSSRSLFPVVFAFDEDWLNDGNMLCFFSLFFFSVGDDFCSISRFVSVLCFRTFMLSVFSTFLLGVLLFFCNCLRQLCCGPLCSAFSSVICACVNDI